MPRFVQGRARNRSRGRRAVARRIPAGASERTMLDCAAKFGAPVDLRVGSDIVNRHGRELRRSYDPQASRQASRHQRQPICDHRATSRCDTSTRCNSGHRPRIWYMLGTFAPVQPCGNEESPGRCRHLPGLMWWRGQCVVSGHRKRICRNIGNSMSRDIVDTRGSRR